MGGLRERNKEKRRQAILDAALELFGSEPPASVTVERVAERAEVATATVYNLVGTRDDLLEALVHRVLDDLVESLSAGEREGGRADPLAAAELIVEQSARAFTASPVAFRYVIGELGGRPPRPGVERFDPALLQIAAMREAQQAGVVRSDLDPLVLGRQIYLSYVGALNAWAGGALDDEAFVTAAHHGLWTVVVAAATEEHRAAMARRWRRVAKDLSTQLGGASGRSSGRRGQRSTSSSREWR